MPHFLRHLHDVCRDVAFTYCNDVLPLVHNQHVSSSGHIRHLSSLCTVLLPPGVIPVAINKYIISTWSVCWSFVTLRYVDIMLAVSVIFQCFAQHCFGMSAFLSQSIQVKCPLSSHGLCLSCCRSGHYPFPTPVWQSVNFSFMRWSNTFVVGCTFVTNSAVSICEV